MSLGGCASRIGREQKRENQREIQRYQAWEAAKTPRDVQGTLHAAIVEVGKDPELQAKIRLMGFTPVDVGLGNFGAYLHSEMKRLAPLLATIGQSN